MLNLRIADYEVTEEIVKELEKAAIKASIAADAAVRQHEKALMSYIEKCFKDKFIERVDGTIGVLHFSNVDLTVMLLRVKPPDWLNMKPYVEYRRQLKNGKFAKRTNSVYYDYFLANFDLLSR